MLLMLLLLHIKNENEVYFEQYYLSSCLFITLLTKHGGLEVGCSVGNTGGGDRACSFSCSNFFKHLTKRKFIIYRK